MPAKKIEDDDWVNDTSRYTILPSGCWAWNGSKDKDGYAKSAGKRYGETLPHRIFHVHFIGPIPPGYEVDHLCKTRCCVNPDHLEAVTMLVNRQRQDSSNHRNRTKTHCMRGHKFTKKNTRTEFYPGGRKQRKCRTCANDGQNRRARERRAAI